MYEMAEKISTDEVLVGIPVKYARTFQDGTAGKLYPILLIQPSRFTTMVENGRRDFALFIETWHDRMRLTFLEGNFTV